MNSFLSHLECAWCGETYEANQLWNLCPACGKPLLARYDLDAARSIFTRTAVQSRSPNLWRYAEMLPVQDPAFRISLGEGYTPLVKLNRLGAALGLKHLYAKDESFNPTGSFKARGLAMAVSRAAELGAKAVAIPTAGNAGSAMAAYAARIGLPAYIYAPQDVPAPFIAEMRALGAEVTLVEGLITDCARYVRQGVEEGRWFDVSTLKEPYRVEGKKTMGYELAEHFDGSLPDIIIYPTGGGTGIIGMWKAFGEMEQLGWIDSQRPRMISVQSTGCAPIVRAYEQGVEFAEPWQNARTIADGLRVPAAVGDFLILRAVRESGGTALAVEDEDTLLALTEIGSQEGLFVAPEAAATFVALKTLVERGDIQADERVVLFLTGTGLKYTHLINGPAH
ncbi:MAG: threonine synthase [Anaerolineae bacterium]|nr:threonine synthase [Anaerolineae bacterium]